MQYELGEFIDPMVRVLFPIFRIHAGNTPRNRNSDLFHIPIGILLRHLNPDTSSLHATGNVCATWLHVQMRCQHSPSQVSLDFLLTRFFKLCAFFKNCCVISYQHAWSHHEPRKSCLHEDFLSSQSEIRTNTTECEAQIATDRKFRSRGHGIIFSVVRKQEEEDTPRS